MSGGEEHLTSDVTEQMQQQLPDDSERQISPKLSESFQVALDVLRRSKDIDKKIEHALPGALTKLRDAETDEKKAEANAIIRTLSADDNPNVRIAVAKQIPLWADCDPDLAGETAYHMAAEGDRGVGMTLAEGLFSWMDENPQMAENVAKKLSKNKGMGVNLALADALPMWAEHYSDLTGKIAKKIAKNYNHLNAVTNLLEKTYGENWRENIESVTGETAEGEEERRKLIAGLFLKAGSHVEEVKVSLASGLSDWAGQNPEAAEEVAQILVDDVLENSNNTHLNKAVNTALFKSLSELAPDNPKTTASLIAVMAQNPDPEVAQSLITLLKDNLNIDPNEASAVAQEIEDHPARNSLIILSRFFDNEGEENLLDQLGIE